MPGTVFDNEFGSVWQELHVTERQGYQTSVTDYHRHHFYEINLILSGNVKILLGDGAEEGCERRIVLTRPNTPHYVACRPDVLYHRLYLLFTEDFVAGHLAEWHELAAVFGENGTALTLDDAQSALFTERILAVKQESSPLRRRLIIYDLLSRLADLKQQQKPRGGNVPPYILQALTYLDEHCGERIVAADLASHLHVGRTTLMTEFKRHLGTTVVDYLTHCRLRHAVTLLQEGSTVETAASLCGFADTSGLIRAFKRSYGMPPREYLEQLKGES